MKKLWGGRFRAKTHPAFEYFSSSLSEDYKLASCDIRASKAHCRMLRKIGVLKPAESARILRALDAVHDDLARHEGDFLGRKYEDIHSFLESELVRRAGDAAKKIHTARSRNDQVNQAARMYCKEHALATAKLIGDVQAAILARAEEHRSLVVAGLTHMQKAQPVLLAHQFLGYVEALERAKAQLIDSLKRIDILTLGSGALAGTSVPIDREAVRKELGFAELSANSLDAVGSRDFIVEFVFVLSQIGVQLSRIAEDFLIGQLDEIGWFVIPEELCTGSSMMPQKRNPDFLELARGAAAMLIGNLNSLQVLLKGLPSSYNRDLQWDKAPLFGSTELVTRLLYLFGVFFDKLEVNRERAGSSAGSDALCATDLAEHLVMRGVPFRQAHDRVGRLVRSCLEEGIGLREAPRALVERELGLKMDSVRALFDPAASVSRKRGTGSTSPVEVEKQIRKWRKVLKHASI